MNGAVVSNPEIPAVFEVVGVAVALVIAVLVVAAIISVSVSRSVTPAQRVAWILGVLFLPALGALAWFATVVVERTRGRVVRSTR